MRVKTVSAQFIQHNCCSLSTKLLYLNFKTFLFGKLKEKAGFCTIRLIRRQVLEISGYIFFISFFINFVWNDFLLEPIDNTYTL